MTNLPLHLWSRLQLDLQLDQIQTHFDNPCFRRDAPFTMRTRSAFIELIALETDLLRQVQLAGRRIDFLDEVGTNGRVEDITSLLGTMNQLLYDFEPGDGTDRPFTSQTVTIISPDFNHFYGAGVGYFANGLFFSCTHEDELAFFVGRYRIYFYRHLVRAFEEAKTYLQSVIPAY